MGSPLTSGERVAAASKPYLESIPTRPEAAALTLQWAHYLGDTFGASGALSSLRYYEDQRWISRSVRVRMADYLRGLSMDEIHNKKYNEPLSVDPPLDSLTGSPFGAHARSLRYVAAIAGDDLTEATMLARLAEHRVADVCGD